jgi:hypothetical protein
MLHILALLLYALTLLSSEVAANTHVRTNTSSRNEIDAHNLSVVTHASMNRFGHATFCTNVADITYAQESDFVVDDCRQLIDALSGPIGYYSYWFTVNDQDCSGGLFWIPVAGKLSCNFAVATPDCPDGGIVYATKRPTDHAPSSIIPYITRNLGTHLLTLLNGIQSLHAGYRHSHSKGDA